MRKSSSGNLPSVLVVEDCDDFREPLCELIAQEVACVVHEATNGQEAIELLQGLAGAPPSILLLDWMMPGMSGADVLSWLSRSARYASIPVVLVTAAPISEAAGVVRVLRKPVAPDLVVDVVRHYCERHREPDGAGKTEVA